MAAALQSVNSKPTDTPQSADKLGAEITELCAYIYAATFRLLVLIREFDLQGGWQQPGLCSCAHWLNFKCGIGMNAAREKVRVAHALGDLPKISAAFERGELSYSKVRAMTRIARSDNEDYLLMIAHHGTAYHMEKLVARFRRAERLQDAETCERNHRERFLDHFFDEDGCLVIKARLPAEQGALVVKALEKAMDDAFRDRTQSRSKDADEDRLDESSRVSAETSATKLASGAYIENGPRVSAETSRRLGCDCSRLRLTEDCDGEPLSIGRKTRSIPPAIRRALRIRDKGCRFPGCTNTRIVDGHHI